MGLSGLPRHAARSALPRTAGPAAVKAQNDMRLRHQGMRHANVGLHVTSDDHVMARREGAFTLPARKSSAAREVSLRKRSLGRVREIFTAGDLPFRAWNRRRALHSALPSVSTV